MSKAKCPTKALRVTTHTWGRWRRLIRHDDGTPFRVRMCLKCGKVARVYGNRGY